MGCLIYLRVGRLEVDWGRNSSFADHNALFQPDDLGDVPYHYAARVDDILSEGGEIVADMIGDEWCLTTELREGYSKPLSEVVDRIEMLGYTDLCCRREFEYLADLNGFDATLFTYDELAAVVREVDVNKVSPAFGEDGEDFGKFFRREIYPRLPFAEHVAEPEHVRYEAAQAMENLSPYTILRLLSDNPSARDLPVIWAFQDVIDGGYIERSDVVHPLAKHERFSIVTEGTSDSAILKKALALLEPHIADFFSFVEVGYPFSGTGGALNFVKGLVAIGVHNNVLVLFDNDAEGRSTCQRCQAIGLPENVVALTLPDLPDFEAVDVDGPTGRSPADINGRAAAIECYLDLGDTARFFWSNFNDQVKAYQGELQGKDAYKKAFLDQRALDPDYDYGKIRAVLTMLRRTAVHMNETRRIEGLRKQERDDEDE